MNRRAVAVVALMVLGILFALDRRSSGSVAGNANPTITFLGEFRGADGRDQYRFIVELERVMFRLLSVQNKYNLVRLRIQNLTAASLALSADKDRLDLLGKSGAPVQAVLNLQRGDSAWWDGLEPGMRETLAYPVALKGVPAAGGGQPSGAPESLYFYAFFPSSQVREIPAGFTYTIASLGQTIRIEQRAAAAR